MYVPKSFQVDDRQQLVEFMQQYSFATLVTIEDHEGTSAPFATHMPLLVRDGRIVGHVAKANPQWRQVAAADECLAIFQGPHAYVSPTWYAAQPAVPTWNYSAVHAYCKARLIESPQELTELLSAMIAFYEKGQKRPWDGVMSPEVREPLLAAIVGFELEITRIEGKFKFNQNRSREDQKRVIEQLSQSTRADDHAAANLMRDLRLG